MIQFHQNRKKHRQETLHWYIGWARIYCPLKLFLNPCQSKNSYEARTEGVRQQPRRGRIEGARQQPRRESQQRRERAPNDCVPRLLRLIFLGS
uniref:Uncharacterized protein n=1 Tax=Arundo donax TaxID=35708 RepID=A0A0A9EAE6_ARUDO